MNFSSYELLEVRDLALYTSKIPTQVPVLEFK